MIQNKLNELRLAFYARIILIIGGLNYLYMGIVSNDGFLSLNLSKNVINALYIIIGISALYLFMNRDYYLPFLGETVIPTIVPIDKNNKNIITTTIKNLPPKSSIIYWAAKSNKDISLIEDPYTAYADYANSGISIANDNGEAKIEYECPVQYKVGMFKKELDRHIHYRYMNTEFPGFLSPVKTLYLNGECK
jgi:uncharacterized membrane protein YuzA (DUF378 family)